MNKLKLHTTTEDGETQTIVINLDLVTSYDYIKREDPKEDHLDISFTANNGWSFSGEIAKKNFDILEKAI
jgi:hypothetical protein